MTATQEFGIGRLRGQATRKPSAASTSNVDVAQLGTTYTIYCRYDIIYVIIVDIVYFGCNMI